MDYIMAVQSGDKESMMFLIEKFKPLLICRANKLHYEDAMNDLLLSFIEGINKIDINRLRCVNDGTITNYIVKIVRHAANYYNKHNHQGVPASLLPNGQTDGFVKKYYEDDDIFSLLLLNLKEFLTIREQQVILSVYVYGYSVSQLAAMQGVSRQNINQIKNRAMRKIRHMLDQEKFMRTSRKIRNISDST